MPEEERRVFAGAFGLGWVASSVCVCELYIMLVSLLFHVWNLFADILIPPQENSAFYPLYFVIMIEL